MKHWCLHCREYVQVKQKRIAQQAYSEPPEYVWACAKCACQEIVEELNREEKYERAKQV